MLFVVFATANAAGYRFGVSDQAFYIPAVLKAIDPASFPRDTSLIDAQGRLMVFDTVIAHVVRWTGLPLDWLFFAGYVMALLLIWWALVLIGRRMYRSQWATVALIAAITLRHHIPRTSANTFEGYFHPRMLAFAFGLLAIAAVLRRRSWAAVGLVAAAAIVHVTTAVWFAVLIGVALARLDPVMRRLGIAAAVGVVALGAWALTSGPLHASMVTMDATWLDALRDKESLFPLQDWHVWTWVANLGLLAVVIAAVMRRTPASPTCREDYALMWGAIALTAVFLVTLPASAMRNAFAVQLQISRVFWLIDSVATIYAIAALERHARTLAIVLIAFAVGRGVYIINVEHAERGLFAVHLEETPWNDAMRWLARQPIGVGVLADPGHAWRYGTSVRVSAGRDVYLEEVKDAAIAMYSRDVAMRVLERTRALGDFSTLTPQHAEELAASYALDFLVADRTLPLPVAYRNTRFTVYRLRGDGKLE